MSYENFQFHRDPLARWQFARAAAAHESTEPPDDHKCVEGCSDCKGSGYQPGGVLPSECLRCGGEGKLYLHEWKRVPGEATDGTKFTKCIHCGIAKEL
jgi:hypothetical protein